MSPVCGIFLYMNFLYILCLPGYLVIKYTLGNIFCHSYKLNFYEKKVAFNQIVSFCNCAKFLESERADNKIDILLE